MTYTRGFSRQQSVQTPPFQLNPLNSNNRFRRDSPNRPTPIVTMNDNEPVKSEAITSAGLWTTPTSHTMRPRPATIHEGFSYCAGEEYGSLSSWDPATLPLQDTPSDHMSSRPISVHQDFYTSAPLEHSESISQPLFWSAMLTDDYQIRGTRSPARITLSSRA